MKKSDLVLSLGARLALLVCIFVVCYVLTAGLSYLIGKVLIAKPAAAVRISTVIQDVVAFIIPAVATACIITRKPVDLLCIHRLRGVFTVPLFVAVLVVSIPFQEYIISWNNSISLPESVDAYFRALENAAAGMMRLLLADTSVPALIVNILIVGIAAGFAEEFLFRGCLQRLLVTGGVNHHVAIWTVAILFSAMHFQIFGFVPRMLLGAYFGYLLLWTRSIWAPVIAHALNNTVYVVTAWIELRRNPDALLTENTMEFAWPVALCSLVATGCFLYILYRLSREIRAD